MNRGKGAVARERRSIVLDLKREKQLTCEVGETLEGDGEECRNPTEVEFKGVDLCGRHARELYARDRADLWRAMVLQLDITLESLDGQRDGPLGQRLELRRAEAAAELELARKALVDRS